MSIDVGNLGQLLTGGMIFLTVATGIYSTWHEHRDRQRKMKLSGWILAFAMITFGGLSIASNGYERRQNTLKEKQNEDKRARQFHAQMGKMVEATTSLNRLEIDMTGSLKRQEQLLDKQNLNFNAVTKVQRLQTANTENILRKVFAEGNRVATERIAISVVTNCPVLAGRFVEYPYVEGVSMVVRRSGPRGVSFATKQHLDFGNGVIFFGFLGDLGSLEELDAWRKASVDIQLDAWLSSNSKHRIGTLDDIGVMSLEEAIERFQKPAVRPEACPVTASLLVNGRTILRVSGNLVAKDSRGYGASFRSIPVNPSLLPSFKM